MTMDAVTRTRPSGPEPRPINPRNSLTLGAQPFRHQSGLPLRPAAETQRSQLSFYPADTLDGVPAGYTRYRLYAHLTLVVEQPPTGRNLAPLYYMDFWIREQRPGSQSQHPHQTALRVFGLMTGAMWHLGQAELDSGIDVMDPAGTVVLESLAGCRQRVWA